MINSPKSKQGNIAIIIVILIVTTVIGVIAYKIIQKPIQTTTSTNTQVAPKLIPTIQPSQGVNPVRDETANWKTYSGKYYSLKYPPTWKPFQGNETGTIISSSNLQMTDFSNVQQGAFLYEPWMQGALPSWDATFKTIQSKENIVIDGQQALLGQLTKTNALEIVVYYKFPKANEFGQYDYISLITSKNDFKDNLELYKKMLSTFKFAK